MLVERIQSTNPSVVSREEAERIEAQNKHTLTPDAVTFDGQRRNRQDRSQLGQQESHPANSDEKLAAAAANADLPALPSPPGAGLLLDVLV